MKTESIKQDYEVARDEAKTLFASLNLSGHLVSRKFIESVEWPHFLNDISISAPGCREIAMFQYMQGSGLKTAPEAFEVLCSSCSDYLSAKDTSFEEWASGLGYDEDSRKAEKTYRACLNFSFQLKSQLNLNDATISQLAELNSRF